MAKAQGPKVLVVDCETSPLSLSGWGMRDQSFGLRQLIETSRILCVGYKWAHQDKPKILTEWRHGQQGMLDKAHALMTEADIVVAHNAPFDVKNLNAAFMLAGMTPPAPSHVVDTLRVVRSQFFFASNRLDHLARILGLGGKVSHEGHGLWLNVLDGHGPSRKLMADYCKHDVVLCEQVYTRLFEQGWLGRFLPHAALYGGSENGCPSCGSGRYQSRGTARTKVSTYRRLHCQDCGTWFRDTRPVQARPGTRVVL